ncbi:MAG: hypothetical protein R3F30_16585 [Planctomycetota bacterium]
MAQMSEKQLILSIAFGGLLLTGGSFGGVYWAKGKIEEEKTQITDLEKKIATAEAKKRRIPQDEKAVIILRENVGEYVKILPNGSELTDSRPHGEQLREPPKGHAEGLHQLRRPATTARAPSPSSSTG